MYNEKKFKLNVKEEDNKPPTLDEVREEAEEKMNLAVKAKYEKFSKASEVEMSIGAYRKEIYPIMQEAVLRLREKGYKVLPEASFNGNVQEIRLEDDQPVKFTDEQKLRKHLGTYGVEIKVEPRSIQLVYSQPMEVPLMAGCWFNIIEHLEKIGSYASPVETERAKEFRKKQAELK